MLGGRSDSGYNFYFTLVKVEQKEYPLPLIRLQQLVQGLCMEFVVAQVQRSVDGLERLKVNIQFLFLSIICHNGACIYDQAIWGDL